MFASAVGHAAAAREAEEVKRAKYVVQAEVDENEHDKQTKPRSGDDGQPRARRHGRLNKVKAREI